MATLGQSDNFYTQLHLDPAASSEELALALARRDAILAGQGLPDSAPERVEAGVAYGVLSKPERRELYDDALAQHRPLRQFELEHLANFGAWPIISAPFEPAPQAAVPAVAEANTVATPVGFSEPVNEPMEASLGQPHTAPVVQDPRAKRPPIVTRAWLSFLDTFAALTLAGVVVSQLPGEGGLLNVFFLTLIMVLYFVLGDAFLGASPFKFMFGYQVQDVRTQEKLSLAKSAQRNWWRIVALVPVVGPVLSVIAGTTCAFSITPGNEQRGSHDRLSSAEVVRREG